MSKIGQNWGKIAIYPPQCSTKICTTRHGPPLYTPLCKIANILPIISFASILFITIPLALTAANTIVKGELRIKR